MPQNTNEDNPNTNSIFDGEEEVEGRYAVQSGVVSQEEIDRIKRNPEEVLPGFSAPYAIRSAGKKTIIDGPTLIAEREFPTKYVIKEPGFVASALAKVLRKKALPKIEKRRALHAVHKRES